MSTKTAPVGYRMPSVPWNGLTVTDLFCGAGGSSSGLVEAGYKVVIAANHWATAIESHQINHPETDHAQADISQVNPAYFPKTHVLWGSPECTNHSIAKGIKRQRQQDQALFEIDGTRPLPDEAANRSRATMWDIPRFAEHHRYMAIILENVVDAYRWDQFEAWQMAMRSLGYRMQFVWLNSMHAQIGGLPAPQSRDRMYIVMWREDLASKDRPGPDVGKWTRPMAVCREHGEVQAVQAFKKAEQWGRYRAQYLYRCPVCWQVIEPGWLAAESIIDWSLPAPRIGDRAKPLAEKTRERIRRGIERYWAGGTHASLLIPVEGREGKSAASAADPLRTQSTRNETGLLVPYYSAGSARPASDPLGTVTTVDREGLVVPLRNHGVAKPTSHPIDTVSAEGNHHALLMRNNEGGAEMSTPVSEPMRTLTTGGHQSLLEPLPPISLDVDDAGFRMLEPHEIQLGMGFAADYHLVGSKRDKVKQAGNAVTPPAARDLGHAVAEFLLAVAA